MRRLDRHGEFEAILRVPFRGFTNQYSRGQTFDLRAGRSWLLLLAVRPPALAEFLSKDFRDNMDRVFRYFEKAGQDSEEDDVTKNRHRLQD